jgi:hypothetical protein
MSDNKGVTMNPVEQYPYAAVEQLQMSQKRIVMATSTVAVIGVAVIGFLVGRFGFPVEVNVDVDRRARGGPGKPA